MEQVGRIAVFYGLVVPDVAYLAVSAGVGAGYFRKLPPIEIAMTVVSALVLSSGLFWHCTKSGVRPLGASAAFFGILLLQILALRISFLPASLTTECYDWRFRGSAAEMTQSAMAFADASCALAALATQVLKGSSGTIQQQLFCWGGFIISRPAASGGSWHAIRTGANQAGANQSAEIERKAIRLGEAGAIAVVCEPGQRRPSTSRSEKRSGPGILAERSEACGAGAEPADVWTAAGGRSAGDGNGRRPLD